MLGMSDVGVQCCLVCESQHHRMSVRQPMRLLEARITEPQYLKDLSQVIAEYSGNPVEERLAMPEYGIDLSWRKSCRAFHHDNVLNGHWSALCRVISLTQASAAIGLDCSSPQLQSRTGAAIVAIPIALAAISSIRMINRPS